MYVHDVHKLGLLSSEGSPFFYFGGGIVIMKNQSAKRVNIVSVKLVKESSMLYKNRCVRSPEDGYQLLKQFLGDVDRKYFVVVCLDTKNQPTAINICHIGSLKASLVHPRECFKPAILSNAASILYWAQSSFRACITTF